MARGRVLRFDQVKGYGFIAPDGGGEDVFLHANDLLTPDKHLLGPGAIVEYQSEHGDRGAKAAFVQIVSPAPGHAPVPSHALTHSGPHPGPTPHPGPHPSPGPHPTPGPIPGPGPSAAIPPQPGESPKAGSRDDDEFVDVLPQTDFQRELTEILLTVSPPLTGPQVLAVREQVVRQCRKYGWVTAP